MSEDAVKNEDTVKNEDAFRKGAFWNEAAFWSEDANGVVKCSLCPHNCKLSKGASGICGVRSNTNGVLMANGYGEVSSVALDPIEKKPLYLFEPGKMVLSIGGYGCNLRCPFCQNYEISMVYAEGKHSAGVHSAGGRSAIEHSAGEHRAKERRIRPEEVAELALRTVSKGNIGVAYTYNEPLINYEFLRDCATLVHEAGLKNVAVTNGYINEEPLLTLLPLIDAMNIDLKAFSERFYQKVNGSAEAVKRTIELASKRCHVEVTTLVIPDENEDDVEDIAKWIASIDCHIPLHLSRFFPRYRYSDKEPTPVGKIQSLCDVARKHLTHVFAGNIRV